MVGVGGIKRPKFSKEIIRLKMQFLEGWGGSNQKALQGESMEI